MITGAWVVLPDNGIYELRELLCTGPGIPPKGIKLFGTETVDRKLLERVAELHNQCLQDLGRDADA